MFHQLLIIDINHDFWYIQGTHFKAYGRILTRSFRPLDSKCLILSRTRCKVMKRWLHLFDRMSNYVQLCWRMLDGRWYSDDGRYIPQRWLSENIHHRVCLECTGSRRHKAPSDIIEFLRCYWRKTKMSKMLPMRNLFIRATMDGSQNTVTFFYQQRTNKCLHDYRISVLESSLVKFQKKSL